jgi:hypothetical protein
LQDVATFFRFLQLLLLRNEETEMPRIGTLLTTLMESLALNQPTPSEGEEEEVDWFTRCLEEGSFDLRVVRVFAISHLLRLNHHFSFQVWAVVPLWKSICDLQFPGIPFYIQDDAISSLLKLLQEGYLCCLKQQKAPISNPNQGKLISFLVWKLVRLLIALTKQSEDNTKWQRKALTESLKLRGLSLFSKKNAQTTKMDRAIWKLVLLSSNGGQQTMDGDAFQALFSCLTVQETALGMALFLQFLLSNQRLPVETQEIRLRLCETLLCRALPACLDSLAGACQISSPLSSSLVQDSMQLVYQEIASFSSQMEQQLNQLLIRWMHEDHPLTRGTVQSIVYLYVQQHPNFLDLAKSLLIDYRTHTRLRCHLSILLQKFSLQFNQTLLRDLFFGKKPRKRKRHKQNHHKFNPQDIEAIAQVLRNMTISNDYLEFVQGILQQTCTLGTKKEQKTRCLALSLMESCLSCQHTGLLNQVCGGSYSQFLKGLLNQAKSKEDPMMLSALVFLLKTTCRYLPSSVPLEDCIRFLDSCLSSSKKNVSIKMTAMTLVPFLGPILTSKPSVIQTWFVQTLSNQQNHFWPMQSLTMTQLTLFAQTLNPDLHEMLPQCLPEDQRKNFRNRVSSQKGHVVSCSSNKPTTFVEQLQLPPQRFLAGNSIFPAKKSLKLSAGSYLLTMNTQEGRTALVIFRPGSQSLEDIEYMLSGQGQEIQVLQRVVGNQCFVTPLKKL